MRVLLSLIAGAAVLAACATATPYAPAGETGRYGYTDTQLESDRWRVSFAGNSITELDAVELNLLFRAAELTLQQGFDWFEIVERTTDEDTRFVGDSSFGYPFYSRFYHPYYGWYSRRSLAGFGPTTIREVTRFEAFAEIKLGQDDAPERVQVYDAREVERNLRNQIVFPDR